MCSLIYYLLFFGISFQIIISFSFVIVIVLWQFPKLSTLFDYCCLLITILFSSLSTTGTGWPCNISIPRNSAAKSWYGNDFLFWYDLAIVVLLIFAIKKFFVGFENLLHFQSYIFPLIFLPFKLSNLLFGVWYSSFLQFYFLYSYKSFIDPCIFSDGPLQIAVLVLGFIELAIVFSLCFST